MPTAWNPSELRPAPGGLPPDAVAKVGPIRRRIIRGRRAIEAGLQLGKILLEVAGLTV